MIYDDPMSTEPLPKATPESKKDADLLTELKDLEKLRGIFKHSGMADELQRDRREEDDEWNRKHGFPVMQWRDWTKERR
jgi:hypothetical protein